MVKTTITVIKADIGSVAGHVMPHEDVIKTVEEHVSKGASEGVIIDYRVFHVGDDIFILMTHDKGTDNPDVHGLAWEAFKKGAEVAKELGLYAAGQDLLKDAFSGNVRGMGPGVAEMEIEERPAEPFVVFGADKTEPGAFNLPLFKIFADPFNTAGLVIDPRLHVGFKFEVYDIIENKRVIMSTPEEMYDLLALIGHPGRYVIKRVYHKNEKLGIAAVVSTEKLNFIAGKYVGKDDPVAIVRAQSGFPAVGEILEAFTIPHIVSGFMRGSHRGPLVPVPLRYAKVSRFDGPPRVVALGFNVKNGRLIGPVDLFDDVAFDEVRRRALMITDILRAHGPFEPEVLPLEEMEYTTLPKVLEALKDRRENIE